MLRLALLAALAPGCVAAQEAAELSPDELRVSYGRGDGPAAGGDSWVEVGFGWALSPDPAAEEVRALREALLAAPRPAARPTTHEDDAPPVAVPTQSPSSAAREDRRALLGSIALMLLGGSAGAPAIGAALRKRRQRRTGRAP